MACSSREESQRAPGKTRSARDPQDLFPPSVTDSPEYPNLLGPIPPCHSLISTKSFLGSLLALPLRLYIIIILAFPLPIFFFFSSIDLNLFLIRTPPIASMVILSLDSALFFFSQTGSTRLPNHLLLCYSVLSSIDSCLLYWHRLTSIHHAASDTAPIDFTFQFESQETTL